MPESSYIGANVPNIDAYDKVVGGRGYPVNVSLPGPLHGKLLRSIYAHAKVISIDTSEAAKLPGVKAILTADDVPQKKFNPIYFMPVTALGANHDMDILNRTVRYSGQPVAAVAATSLEIAEQALELIEVEYEELPAVFTTGDALADGAVQQGIGYALMEDLQFDPESGACLCADFLDYKMPTAMEMPDRIETIFIESNEETGLFGAKSLAECCLIVPAPAIANAEYNAVGVRIRELPITPEKILAGLDKL